MNKSAIKQMATLVWFAFISVSLWGQGFHVYTKDGQRHDFLHADVDSIVFASDAIGEEQPPIELPTVAEAVDLGLPSGTKWASWNVGASSPEEYGGYYAWGEVEEKSEYSWSNYKWCDGERTSITKYGVNSSYGIVDNLTTLDAGDDVAQMEWGEGWRMPTNDEIKELFDECKWSWTFVNGVNGQLVTGPNGNSIFMPAAGFYKDNQVKGGGSYLSYLSSSLYLNGGSCGVAVLYFFSGNNNWDDTWGRCYGRSVRPVYNDGSSADVPEDVHPVNTIGEASAITSQSALVEGICNTVQGLGRNYQLGFLYNTTGSPNYDNAQFIAVDHRSTGKFSTTLEGLEPATTYYYCACIKANEDIWYYGETLSFVTSNEEISIQSGDIQLETKDGQIIKNGATVIIEGEMVDMYGVYGQFDSHLYVRNISEGTQAVIAHVKAVKGDGQICWGGNCIPLAGEGAEATTGAGLVASQTAESLLIDCLVFDPAYMDMAVTRTVEVSIWTKDKPDENITATVTYTNDPVILGQSVDLNLSICE